MVRVISESLKSHSDKFSVRMHSTDQNAKVNLGNPVTHSRQKQT